MSRLLTIPDDAYRAAAQAVAKFHAANDPNVDAADIEDEFRSYVDLGIHKLIPDWAVDLDDDTKGVIANAVIQKTRQDFFYAPDFTKVFVDLNGLITAAAIGQASVRIAYPRAAQEQYDLQQQQGYQAPGVGQTILDSITGLFKGAGQSVQAALKGLGIDIPLGFLLVLLVVVAFMFFTHKGA